MRSRLILLTHIWNKIFLPSPRDSNNLSGSLASSDGTRGRDTWCPRFACHLQCLFILVQWLGCRHLSSLIALDCQGQQSGGLHVGLPVPSAPRWALTKASKVGRRVGFWLTARASPRSCLVSQLSPGCWILTEAVVFNRKCSVLLHTGVPNEVQIRCNWQFYEGCVSASSSERELPFVMLTSHSQICIHVCSLTRYKHFSIRNIQMGLCTWLSVFPGMQRPLFSCLDLTSGVLRAIWMHGIHWHTDALSIDLKNNQQLDYNRLWLMWSLRGDARQHVV